MINAPNTHASNVQSTIQSRSVPSAHLGASVPLRQFTTVVRCDCGVRQEVESKHHDDHNVEDGFLHDDAGYNNLEVEKREAERVDSKYFVRSLVAFPSKTLLLLLARSFPIEGLKYITL